ncbi:MAG: ATP-dependent helicase HrpB [Alphaproteobacteria bacterium]|nr:ATP-dependent helicase HrpB [Alphaproteobacteria bacterium]
MPQSETTYPVDAVLPDLDRVLAAGAAAVLVAAPGAGKTTRVPPALARADWARGRKIILLSPRRVAARAAAARMAAECGENVGETVGFRVRLESRIGPRTRIEVVTEGVFTRMILADPALEGVACVIFDEFHERSLEGDLGLALARDAQLGLREDLRLLVMSATLDAARVAALLGGAPVIEAPGRMHPVALRHVGRTPHAPIEPQMAKSIARAMAADEGSVLAFLPGAREIERTAEALRDTLPRDVDLHTLYGALDARAQDAAIAPPPPGRRKIVLATSIAETSLTIDGVRIVVDSGLARRPLFEPATGLTRLVTGRVSQASAAQRAGRAGRTAPGVCVRLWDEGETRAFAPFDPPDILQADLASFALDLGEWGVADPAGLAFLDPPPAAALAEARAGLRELGALDGDGRITPHGKRLSAFGQEPRVAHMILAASAQGRGRLAARLAMALTEQGLGGRDTDIRTRLAALSRDGGPRVRAALRMAESLADRAGAPRDEPVDPDAAGLALALAFPDRVAKAREGKPGEFVMANGRAAALEPTDALARAPFLVVAEAQGRAERARIVLAAPISARDVEALFADRIERIEDAVFDSATGAVRPRRVRRLGRIVLSEGPGEKLTPAVRAAALLEAVREGGLAHLDMAGADQLRARIALLRTHDAAGGWPDWSDDALFGDLEAWLAPALLGAATLAEVDVAAALEATLDYAQRRRLDELAPARMRTQAGSDIAIDYAADGGPSWSVRLQELFGLTVHPAVVQGRAPLTVVLLSPAQRPIQTTRDLPGFWRGSYAAVRADMRGRYPKHPWPDDPTIAEPTRRAKPRP